MARIRFDRNELAGAFGDIGTDLPLLVGMIPAAGLDSANVFILFGSLQILTGVVYGMPMPMQPLKAMAVLVISNRIVGNVLHGAGLAIGIIMLLLALSGVLEWLARLVPKCVVRGLQFGLGVTLALLALKNYVPAHGAAGYAMAAVAFAVMIALGGNRRWPAGLFVILLGVVYALLVRVNGWTIGEGVGLAWPRPSVPSWSDIATGFVVLTIPQLPLSLGNAVIATRQTVQDLFPDRAISVRQIGVTYGALNIVASCLGGVPVCHGCGGIAGHYAFGARTGGSVILYGSVYLTIGLFFSRAFDRVVEVFPLPILGVVLLFEALTLMRFIGDQADSKRHFGLALMVAALAFGLEQGYVVGLVFGTVIYYLPWTVRETQPATEYPRANLPSPLPGSLERRQ